MSPATTRRTASRSKGPDKTFLLALIVLALLAVAATFLPLASPLLVGAVLAALLWPARVALTKRFKGHAVLATSVLVAAIVLVLLGALFVLVWFAIAEASAAYEFVLQALRGDGVRPLLDGLPNGMRAAAERGLASLPNDSTQLSAAMGRLLQGGQGGSAALHALSATGQFTIATALMLIALFALLLQGGQLLTWIEDVTPARHGQLAELLADCRKVTSSVIASTLLTSATQAAAALLGYLIAGVPHPWFFAFVTFVFACVPAIGAAAVCAVAALLLLVTGAPYWALALFIWGVVVVGLADNVVKPLLMHEAAELDATVVFFSLVGGLVAFGAIGLIVGPLFVCVLISTLRIYRRDYRRAPRTPKAAG